MAGFSLSVSASVKRMAAIAGHWGVLTTSPRSPLMHAKSSPIKPSLSGAEKRFGFWDCIGTVTRNPDRPNANLPTAYKPSQISSDSNSISPNPAAASMGTLLESFENSLRVAFFDFVRAFARVARREMP